MNPIFLQTAARMLHLSRKPGSPPVSGNTERRGLALAIPHLPAAALFLILAIEVTYPIWLDPSERIAGRGDALLNSYILDWIHYAIFHQLGDFFQATVFWPHADALAYGEHLLVPALLVLPLRVFTSSAVALHNFSVIQAFIFSALSAYALAFFYFRARIPATVAGLVYGFAQYRMVQSGHIQLAHGEFLPLAALAIEILLRRDQRSVAILLGASLAAQALTSWYWAIFTFWVIGAFMLLRLWQSRAAIEKKLLLQLILPCIIAVFVTLPMAMPYIDLTRKNILVRPQEASEGLSARPGDYFHASPRYWASTLEADGEGKDMTERQLYPGLMAILVLLGVALCVRKSSASPPVNTLDPFPRRLWGALLATMLIFSFGSSLPIGGETGFAFPLPYLLVEKLFPFAAGVRVTARWILPALLPAAMLSAYATWWLKEALKRQGHTVAAYVAPLALCLLIAADAFPHPARFLKVPSEPPPFCAWLARQNYPAPVVELPILADTDNLYMLHATWHRQPTMNGTNGFFPPDHQRLLRDIGAFGSAEVLEKLRGLQVRHIVIHPQAYPREKMTRTPMGDLLKQAETKAAGGDFSLHIFGKALKARWIGNALIVDLGPSE